MLDAFDVSQIISEAISLSHTPSDICSGFYKSEIWTQYKCILDASVLEGQVTKLRNTAKSLVPTLAELVDMYKKSSRKLQGDAVQHVTKAGTILNNTSYGAHFTSRHCLDALEKNEIIRKNKAAMSTTKNVGPTALPDRRPLLPCLKAACKAQREWPGACNIEKYKMQC